MSSSYGISWPSDTVTVIDAIREEIGRYITINVTVSGIACSNPNCSLNPITNLSTNQYCSTCHGQYWISTTSGFLVKAHITWRPSERPIWETGGLIVDGDCLVQMKYTVSGIDAVDNADNFEVDGKTLLKKTVEFRGVPDINRILVVLQQQDDD